MIEKNSHHLIVLWHVWDAGADPRQRRPDALLERHSGAFDHAPGGAEIRAALVRDADILRETFDEQDSVGYAVVADAAWKAIVDEGGWADERMRRHDRGGRKMPAERYGLSQADLVEETGRAWAPARDYGPPVEAVAETLRGMEQAIRVRARGFDQDR